MEERLGAIAGLAAAALMAAGIALVVVGRKKAAKRRTVLGPLPLQRGAGVQLGARVAAATARGRRVASVTRA